MNHLIFDNENKIKFLMLSIKAHDFIHDFNTTSMSDRLNKIATVIGSINSTLQQLIGVKLRGGGNRVRRNRNRSRDGNRDTIIDIDIDKDRLTYITIYNI